MPETKTARLTLQWDSKARRYRNSDGRFVARAAVLNARDKIVDDVRGSLRALSQDYMNGKITLLEWQLGMKDSIKAAHTLAAGIAMGGKANMTPSDWGRVGAMIKVQYQALNNFALQLEQGRALHLGRVDQYAKAVRMTFLNSERLRVSPFTLARWVRTKTESCEGCLGQEARRVQPLASFPPIGSQPCRMNCGCFISYEG